MHEPSMYEGKMKKTISFLFTIISTISMCFSQNIIVAQKELIATITVGDEANQASYYSDDEGFYSPKGPIVSQKGELIFLPNRTNEKIQIFANGSWKDYPAPQRINISEVLNRQMTSFGGFSYNQSGFQFIVSTIEYFYYNYFHKTNEYYNYDKAYPTPFGMIQYSDKLKEGIAVVFDRRFKSEVRISA